MIQCLIEAYPQGAKERDLSEDGSLALHGACCNEKTLQKTVRLLHKHNPQGVRTRNNKGMLPMHYAAGHSVLAVMRLLGKLYPQAAQMKDSVAGCLPLHYAATRGTQTAIYAIKYCIELFPDGVQVKASSNDYLPLHYAAQHNFMENVDTILYLIDQYPDAIQEPSRDGSLPLHLAALHGRKNGNVVQFLYQEYPDAVRIPDHQGHLPLHNLARNTKQATVEMDEFKIYNYCVLPIFQYLVEKYPRALTIKTNDGNNYLPLHLALRNRHTGSAIRFLIEHYPDAAHQKTTCDEEFLPLHLAACSSGLYYESAVTIIQTLIKLCPHAVRVRTAKTGCLPLHCAAIGKHCAATSRFSDKSVIQALIEHFPESIRETNHDGCLLLHLLLVHSEYNESVTDDMRVEFIQYVVELFPQALKEKDRKGLLPLHYAARNSPSISVIRYLVEQFPDSVKEKDHDGNLPLHAAMANESLCVMKHFKVFEYLLDRFPDGVREQNASGSLPLHVASRRDQRRYYYHWKSDIFGRLVKLYPDSVRVKDAQGRLPLHVASRYMIHNLDVLNFFMTQYPNGVREKDVDGYLPLHHACRKSNPTSQCANAIRKLIQQYPEALQVRTKDGLLPMYMLLTSFQQTSLDLIYFCMKSNPSFISLDQDDAAVNNEADSC